MNDRQQRAQAAIMAIISALPWTERAAVFKAVATNDYICPACGDMTRSFGDCPTCEDVIDGAGWAEAAFEPMSNDELFSWARREGGPVVINGVVIHARSQ